MITCHLAQGSQYNRVLVFVEDWGNSEFFWKWLYTAITRAKKQVIIVGERRALCIAIKKQDTEKRGTQLAERLKELSH